MLYGNIKQLSCMKNIFIFILIVVLFSCSKKPDCYKCILTFDVTHRDSVESVSWTVTDEQTLCEMTESKIREFELNNKDTTVYVSGTVTTTTISSAKCTQ
jgi:hypothetical protein